MLFILVIGILRLVELALFNYPEVTGKNKYKYSLLTLSVKKNLTKRIVIKLNLYVLRPSQVVLVIVAVTAVNQEDDPIVPLTLLASRYLGDTNDRRRLNKDKIKWTKLNRTPVVTDHD